MQNDELSDSRWGSLRWVISTRLTRVSMTEWRHGQPSPNRGAYNVARSLMHSMSRRVGESSQ